MNSMTGYGHAESWVEETDIIVDLRTFNSRYFDFRARLSKEISSLEAELRREIQSKVSRGRVELSVELIPRSSDQFSLNEALVSSYFRLAERLNSLGVNGNLQISEILGLPGVCISKTLDLTAETVLHAIRETLRKAVDQVVGCRQAEGRALEAELASRMHQLEVQLELISGRADEVRVYFENRLRARLDELIREGPLDENRLAQEVSYYAEKSDITEEITRLSSHLDRSRKYLEDPDQGPVGKSMDFLCQEMNREINTILSKSALVEVSHIALEAKEEIERIREQVQNVE